jgi:hypothetical protein
VPSRKRLLAKPLNNALAPLEFCYPFVAHRHHCAVLAARTRSHGINYAANGEQIPSQLVRRRIESPGR